MTVEEVRGLLILTILPLMAAQLLVIVLAWLACRRGFGGYLKVKHPGRWAELAPQSELIREFTPTLDVTPALRRFRRETTDDCGDSELRLRRNKANRLERVAVIGFLALGGWVALVIGSLAFID